MKKSFFIVLCHPCHLIFYIYVFYWMLVFSFRLKFAIILFIFFLFTGLYVICIALTSVASFTNS